MPPLPRPTGHAPETVQVATRVVDGRVRPVARVQAPQAALSAKRPRDAEAPGPSALPQKVPKRSVALEVLLGTGPARHITEFAASRRRLRENLLEQLPVHPELASQCSALKSSVMRGMNECEFRLGAQALMQSNEKRIREVQTGLRQAYTVAVAQMDRRPPKWGPPMDVYIEDFIGAMGLTGQDSETARALLEAGHRRLDDVGKRAMALREIVDTGKMAQWINNVSTTHTSRATRLRWVRGSAPAETLLLEFARSGTGSA